MCVGVQFKFHQARNNLDDTRNNLDDDGKIYTAATFNIDDSDDNDAKTIVGDDKNTPTCKQAIGVKINCNLNFITLATISMTLATISMMMTKIHQPAHNIQHFRQTLPTDGSV